MIIIFVILSSVASAATTFAWSGQSWTARSGSGNPGNNQWSNSHSAVYVDSSNRLHLSMFKSGRRWYSTEVDSVLRTYTYGTYTWFVSSPILSYDPNIVCGLFYFYNDSCELDIESSQWGNAGRDHLCYSVQPDSINGDSFGFIPVNSPYLKATNVKYAFDWEPTYVHFTATLQDGTVIADYKNTDVKWIPHIKSAIGMNIWLNDHIAPTNDQGAQMVINSFSYSPSGAKM